QMRRADKSLAGAKVDGARQRKGYVEAVIAQLRDGGRIICVSDDKAFIDLLRGLIRDELKMPATCLFTTTAADMLVRLARQARDAGESPLFLVERELRGRDLSFAVRLLKNGFPELKVLMLAGESARQHVAQMQESGVDGSILRPVDGPGLLERLALTLRPQNEAERSLEWARSLLAQGENLRALQVCMQALEQKNNPAAVLLLMGDIFKAMEEFDKAADAYAKAAGASPMFLEPLRRLAVLHAEKGDAARELECLEKLDGLSPLDVERKLRMGELSLRLNQTDKARKVLGDAVRLSSRQAKEGTASVASRVADLYAESDPETAAAYLRRALDSRKEFWGQEDLAAFNRLGLLLRRAGRWRDAVEEYRKALAIAPNDGGLQYNLGMAWLDGKENEQARAACLKALALNPELPRSSARVAMNLATVFLATNDRMHALPLLRTALELEPGNAEARDLLARAEAEGR
ncbi:tetratricopeptide repeat protein, partial [Desulfovibrio sp.]|uniref:tetratricopeptide repeat protein n=1 Tax=Desulfovibrio sp. TaxID=885 RepID=UPI00260FD275